MDVGFFLRSLFPTDGLEAIREEFHVLLYGYGGAFDLATVKAMTKEERTWFVDRVFRQKAEEARAIEDAGKGKG